METKSMPLSAQIEVNSDGSVRMGTTPGESNKSVWTMVSGGMEVNLGTVIFHTPDVGDVSISGRRLISGGQGNLHLQPFDKHPDGGYQTHGGY